jgi:hypothetical protein
MAYPSMLEDFKVGRALTDAQKQRIIDIDFYRLAQVAYHEAAHAVVALHFDYTCRPEIYVRAPRNEERNSARWLGSCESNTQDDPQHRALVSIAGLIGEHMVGGAVTDPITLAKVFYWHLDIFAVSKGDLAGLPDQDAENGGITQGNIDECVRVLSGAWTMVESIARQVMDEIGASHFDLEKGWSETLIAAFHEYSVDQSMGSVYAAEDLAQERADMQAAA